jgi:hypothetical protein
VAAKVISAARPKAALASIYMNRFLKHWRQMGRGKAFRAHIVSYADDFVILSRGHASVDEGGDDEAGADA